MIRPLQIVKRYEEKYPHIWRNLDKLKEINTNSGYWPNWCFMPIELVANYFYDSNPVDVWKESMRLSALYSWRISQGIYRFDPEFLNSLASTEVNKIPVEILFRLPEWCVYVEDTGEFTNSSGEQIQHYGYFVYISYLHKENRAELVVVSDYDGDLAPLPIPLKSTIDDALQTLFGKYRTQEIEPDQYIRIKEEVSATIATVLYLCSVNQDISREKIHSFTFANPKPKKTKKGLRFFPPNKPTYYEVGFGVGKAIREYQSGASQPSGEHYRPHIRRAHWHTFLSGKRDGVQEKNLKWLPPIAVNFNAGEIIPTIHNVKDLTNGN